MMFQMVSDQFSYDVWHGDGITRGVRNTPSFNKARAYIQNANFGAKDGKNKLSRNCPRSKDSSDSVLQVSIKAHPHQPLPLLLPLDVMVKGEARLESVQTLWSTDEFKT